MSRPLAVLCTGLDGGGELCTLALADGASPIRSFSLPAGNFNFTRKELGVFSRETRLLEVVAAVCRCEGTVEACPGRPGSSGISESVIAREGDGDAMMIHLSREVGNVTRMLSSCRGHSDLIVPACL